MGKLSLNRLAVRFAALLVSILVVVIALYAAWSSEEQRQASEQKALGEARLLTQQMNSAWAYVDSVQDRINYNSDGRYDFKGIYCSVAGKSIALRFTQETDCVIRYTREDPRTGSDEPDAFEAEALASFERGAKEHYDVVDYAGRPAFRYASALFYTYGCLSCHGEPAGEVDQTGFPKEGKALGDLAGAVSLVIPMEQYQLEAASRSGANVALFVVLVVAVVACTSLALHRWVTKPLSELSAAVRSVGQGRFEDGASRVRASCEIAGLAASFSDMERRLKRFYDDLEEQVRSRTIQLEEANGALEGQRDEIARMNERLVKANRLLVEENEYKSSFLATMSHELRTPLSSIIAFVEVWLRSAGGKDASDVEIMREIKRNGERLLASINNTLDAASIEAKRFPVDVVPVDLLDVANAVEEVALPLAQEKGVEFSTRIDPSLPLVATDPNILHKILVNLAGNAVKFTEPGGRVEQSVALDEEARRIVLCVSDTGIGIPPEDAEAVFERFRQKDSSISRTHGGSGLGLSLVREMAELLGGTASVESEPGRGSAFRVLVPYGRVDEEGR